MRAHAAAAWLTCAWIFGGMVIEWHAAEDRAWARVAKVRSIGDGNLQRAERMLKACFDHARFSVGTAIYRCRAERSELTTEQFPELRGGAL